ncbi:MAG TPA: hypothetical protein VGM39_25645 [Kofleriaceae bacterium]
MKKRAFETDEDNVVRQEQAQGEVRPDGPGDATSPVGEQTPKAPPSREKPQRRP